MTKNVRFALLCLMMAIAISAHAQDGFDFTAGINIGTDTLPDPADPTQTDTWNRVGFQPELAFGPFGIGLDLTVRFNFVSDGFLEFYAPDWIPNYEGNGTTFFDLYLPRIMYIRYGERGEPIYAKFGSMDDITLGTGFIMGGYSNMRFLPETRIFGLDLGIDGSLFGFPYVGIEALTGNLAKFDVIGGRIYVRPFVWLEMPIVQGIQLGVSAVTDTQPYAYSNDPSRTGQVTVYGGDIIVPIIGGDMFPLAAFADYVVQPNDRSGFMIGFGGKLLGLLTYGGQLRLLGPGFIPSYFDSGYDLFRELKYDSISVAPTGESFAGWFASLGATFLEDAIYFNASLDGPFAAIPAAYSGNPADYPHLRAVFHIEEGFIAGFGLDAFYEKYFIGADVGFFEDLISPEYAVIGASINYKTGAAVISLIYDIRYDPTSPDGFEIRSSLQSTIKF
jgi:hypothetical protein